MKPPFKVSAKPNGHVGQLDISWDAKVPEFTEDETEYRIRYSSRSVGEQTEWVCANLFLLPDLSIHI